MIDPTDKVNGAGVARLRAAGVAVDVAGGEIERAARRQNAWWLTLALLRRPHVTYKAAISTDGRTAASPGGARWISSPESRAQVHELRAQVGAVAVGIGTALADDPLLTARDIDPPAEHQPLRVVFDPGARLPAGSRLAVGLPRDAGGGLRRPGAAPVAAAGWSRSGLSPGQRWPSSPAAHPCAPARRRATLATAFLDAGLIDRVMVYRAPVELGERPGLFTRRWTCRALEHRRGRAPIS